MAAAQFCHKCRTKTATIIHCVTEATNVCLSCDISQHLDPDAGHVRYRFCEKCMISPAAILCYGHKIVICQPCYSLHYKCSSIYGHRIELFNPIPLRHRLNNNINDIPERYVGQQRRERLFEMICYGNGNCERWLFPVYCETCDGGSNAVVYCYQHDHLLCHSCDRIFHCPCRTVQPPHMRYLLCVTCKILSHNFLMAASQFSLPPTHPPAVADEVLASPSTGPSQQDSNFS